MTDRRQNYESAVAALVEQLKQFDAKKTKGFGEVHRLAVRLENTDPLAWLNGQKVNRKIYQRDREAAYETAGAGAARVIYLDTDNRFEPVFKSLEKYKLQDENIRFYGGFRFHRHHSASDKDRDWDGFYGAYFILPRFELTRTAGQTELAVNIFIDPAQPDELNNALAQIKHSLSVPVEPDTGLPNVVSRTDTPDRPGWDDMMERAAEFLERQELQKIVLARKAALTCEKPVNPFAVLSLLREKNDGCYLFAFQFESNAVFIGASPERLYLREGRTLVTEALAGTRPRGKDADNDARLRDELLASEKDRREHGYVRDSILDHLKSVSEGKIETSAISVRQLDRVQHLHCRIECVLRENIGDAEILTALHPTPAVGGLPREKALMLMRELEPFERGWYAAPVGQTDGDRSEFAVAIRSALIKHDRLLLFAGAGIVEGSDAGAEWQEIDNKLGNFVHLFE